jgi:hypothetical protein
MKSTFSSNDKYSRSRRNNKGDIIINVVKAAARKSILTRTDALKTVSGFLQISRQDNRINVNYDDVILARKKTCKKI